MESRRKFIEEEIRVQVEALRKQLDDCEQLMQEKLKESCHNLSVNITEFKLKHDKELEGIKRGADLLKSQAFSYAADPKPKDEKHLNVAPLNRSANKCLSFMNHLNSLNKSLSDMIEEVRFIPNIEGVTMDTVGKLKFIKEINIKDQFRVFKDQNEINCMRYNLNKKLAISPRYLCIADKNNMLFSDSQTKQLVQVTISSGDYVNSTCLEGVLKNPDGISVNYNKGHIFVSDCELGIVFKLDSKFNLIKRIGQKDLKWPRGLYYDSDSENPDRLYVCDYLNERISIFNEQDQLRDTIVISAAGKLLPSFNNSNGNGKYDQNEIEDEFKFAPLNILVTGTHIYVADDWVGGNCIRVFDKKTHALIRNVGDLQCWNPLGIFVDDQDNIFTIGRLYYETGATFLFCFDKEGKLLYKTNLNLSSSVVHDFLVDKFTDNSNFTIVACGENKLHYIHF